MSYHETFEFFAIDRCLTRSELRSLRAISSRATITPTRFYNYYDWGGLKADPADLLRRYFDVFVYTEAGGARWALVRFPTARIELARWRPYVASRRTMSVVGGCTSVATEGEFTFLTLAPSEDAAFGSEHSVAGEADDEDWAAFEPDGLNGDASWPLPLALIRADLLAGDLRALYLVWLGGVQRRERAVGAREPIHGATLHPLSGTLGAFAEFLRIDTDLLTVALEGPHSPRLRTAGELLRAARSYASEQRRRAAARAAIARTKRLEALERKQASEWIAIDKLLRSSKVRARTYEDVVGRLEALHELAVDRGTIRKFAGRLDALLDRYPTKAPLRRRLRERELTRRGDRE